MNLLALLSCRYREPVRFTPAALADAAESAGRATDSGNTSGYPAAVQELTDLAPVPETATTAAQQAEAQADVSALDSFFNTPALTPN
jgi:hypothetical protein